MHAALFCPSSAGRGACKYYLDYFWQSIPTMLCANCQTILITFNGQSQTLFERIKDDFKGQIFNSPQGRQIDLMTFLHGICQIWSVHEMKMVSNNCNKHAIQNAVHMSLQFTIFHCNASYYQNLVCFFQYLIFLNIHLHCLCCKL